MSKFNLDDVKVKESVKTIASALIPTIKYDDKGQGKADKETIEATLPEGLTMKTVNQVDDWKSDFTSALNLANGLVGTPYLKKNKDLDSVTLIAAVGKDKLESNLKRSSEVRNIVTGETRTVFGNLNAKYRKYGSTSSSGNLKTVRDYVSTMAEEMLG